MTQERSPQIGKLEVRLNKGRRRFVQRIGGLFREMHRQVVEILEPHVRDISGVHWDITQWDMRAEDLVRHFTRQIPDKVRPILEEEYRRVEAATRDILDELEVPTVGRAPSHSGDFVPVAIGYFVSLLGEYLHSLLELTKEGRGRPVAEIRRALGVLGDQLLYRVVLIAENERFKLFIRLMEEGQRNAGISRYRWQTRGDDRVRPTHRKNSGRVFHWSNPPAITGHPGHQVNCRCWPVPIHVSR